MFNVLIADDNFDYAKNLKYLINHYLKEAKVTHIAKNGHETLDALNSDIDIVLLDLKMPVLTGIEVINNLSKIQQEKYKNAFIIITGEIEMLTELKLSSNEVIYKILPKTLENKKILNSIEDLINEKKLCKTSYILKSKITTELLSLGYNISCKGTKYLIDIIELVYIRGEELSENLNKYVYPIIAKRYNQSINNIKINVLRATENMYYNCKEEKLIQYFLFDIPEKPSIKTVINTILLKIHKNS